MQYKGTKVVLRDGLELTKQVQQDIVIAWQQLQNLHRTQPGKQYKCMVSGKGWKISSLDGRDKIEILGYKQEEKKEEKELIKLKTVYEFIPGICMINGDNPERHYAYNDISTYEISVCITQTWQGRKCLTGETAAVETPGDKWPDVPGFDVLGLIEFGTSDPNIYFPLDEWHDGEESESDNEFNPLPYQGYSLDLGALDYGYFMMKAVDGTINLTHTFLSDCFQNQVDYTDAYILEVEAEPDKQFLGRFHNSDGACNAEDEDGCCTDETNNSNWLLSGTCSAGHLLFEIEIMQLVTQATYDPTWASGFCFGYDNALTCDMAVSTFVDTTMGNTQNRLVTDEYSFLVQMETSGLADRAAGEIVSPGAVYESRSTKNYTLASVCDEKQKDTYRNYDFFPFVWELAGAYIQDSDVGSQGILQDKYLMLYIQDTNDILYQEHTDDEWHLTPHPTYKAGGVYEHGTPGSISGSWDADSYMILYADVNGTKVEIDRVDTNTYPGYITVTDSHIVTVLGSVYYMYAYVITQNTDKNNVIKVKYGYFKDTAENHVRSPVFTPSGLTDSGGRITCHHNVFGSENFDTPLYGIGKCAGFLTKKVKEYI